MTTLVVAEHEGGAPQAATLSTVTAAQSLEGDVHVLVAGHGCRGVAEAAARIAGVARVLYSDDARYAYPLAEELAPHIAALVRARGYDSLAAPATTFGKNVLPRAAALLDIQPISDVMEIISPDTFRRPIYAGNAVVTVRSHDAVKALTIRATSFGKAASGAGKAAVEALAPIAEAVKTSRLIGMKKSESSRPDLSTARVVVSGGRGLQSGDNFKLVEALADKLGAALGASRAAVDAGFVTNDLQVGQTGKIVAPDLYIAIGISGAIQHLAGIKDAQVIVAINKDPEAPIFKVADYRLVADLFKAVPELTARL